MAQPPKNIPPALNHKWLVLRQKHQDESNDFQLLVTRNRAELDAHTSRARKVLLAKHISEESDFWSKNAESGGAAEAVKSNRTQTPSIARSSVAPSRKTATPVAKTPAPPAANLRMQAQPPVTPARVSQYPRHPRLPPAPQKPGRPVPVPPVSRSMPLPPVFESKYGNCEVIDLTSDNENSLCVAEETPFFRKKPAQKPAPQQQGPDLPVVQDPMEIDEVQSSTPSSMPEANIELFGGSSSKHLTTPVRTHIKHEYESPTLASPFAKMGITTTSKALNGFQSPEPASSLLQRASTVTPQFGSSGAFSFRVPSPLSSPNNCIGVGLHIPAIGLSSRAGSAMPSFGSASSFDASSPSFNKSRLNSNAQGISDSSEGFPSRHASAAPPPSFTFQNKPSFQASPPVPQVFEPEANSWAKHGRLFQQQREHPVISDNANDLNKRGHGVVQGSQDSETTEDCNVEMQDASPRAGDAPQSELSQRSMALPIATTHRSSPFGHLESNGDDPFTATGARVSSLRKDGDAQQLQSPPPTAMSEAFPANRRGDSTIPPDFKRPSLPASAAPSFILQPVATEARHVRAGTTDSSASSLTLPSSTCNPQRTSVTSRTSGISGCMGATQNRKRKLEIDLSSDEDEEPESDYVPSEPDSPSTKKSMKITKSVHTVKKSKANDGTGVAAKATPRVQKFLGKNGYGFRFTPMAKPKLGATSTPSSCPPSNTSIPASTLAPRRLPHSSVRSSTEAVQPKPKTTSTSRKTLKNKPIPQPSKRLAAVAAENKIQGYFDDTEAFETECAIEEADHMEDARFPDSMRRMSITPSAASQEVLIDGDTDTVDMLASSESPKGFKAWSQTRATGDRKLRVPAIVADSSDSEADISEYISVGGIIVRRGSAKSWI